MNQQEPMRSLSMLRTILEDLPSANWPVTGADKLTDHEKEFLLITCSSTIIIHAIAHSAQYNIKEAKVGLESLIASMHTHMNDVCKENA